jgi:hypothetical protein
MSGSEGATLSSGGFGALPLHAVLALSPFTLCLSPAAGRLRPAAANNSEADGLARFIIDERNKHQIVAGVHASGGGQGAGGRQPLPPGLLTHSSDARSAVGT